MSLTMKQKLFAEYYIVENFNATQAAIRAGYSKKTAYSQGSRMLKNVEVNDYIEEMLKTINENRKQELENAIANKEEILQYYTRVMRGEEKDQFDLDASLKDRTEAAKEIKRSIDRDEDKVKGNNTSLEKLDALLDKMNEVANE